MLPINGDLNFNNNPGILNLGAATVAGQPIIYEQFNTAMSNKADLVGGIVPTSQLPSGLSSNTLDFTNTFLCMGG